MLPLPPREMLLHALGGTPDIFDALLGALPFNEPRWDERYARDRYTLREILGHMADMETVWHERALLTVNMTEPFLPDIDPDRLLAQNSPVHSKPFANLLRFRQSRLDFIALLRSLPHDAWERRARREHVGVLTLHDQVVYTLTHDVYHTHQIAQWLQVETD